MFRFKRAFFLIIILLLALGLVSVALAAASAQGTDEAFDCAAYENYSGAEPEGYAANCASKIERGFERAPAPASALAPGDTAYALDIGFVSDNFFTHTLSNFPAQTIISATYANAYFGMDFTPDAGQLWAHNFNTNQIGVIDLITGDFIPVAPTSINPGETFTGLTIDPRTGLFYASGTDGAASTLYTIDPFSGITTTIGNVPSSTLLIDIAMNCQGELYGHDIGTDKIVQIDPATGVDTEIGDTGLDANFAQGMDFDNKSGTLYIYAYMGGGTNTYGTVDLATGAVIPLSVDNPLGEFEGAVQNTCPSGTLTGQVTSANTGLGLSGASVQAYNSVDFSGAVSNPSGQYTVTLPTGSYTVSASLTGYFPAEVSGVQVVSGTTTIQDLALADGELAVAPDRIEDWVTLGFSVTNQMVFSNTGTATLTFDVFDYEPGGITGPGGPDNFGYTYADQNDPSCSFNYVPITTTGTLVASGDDVSSVNSGIFSPIALGEPFNIYRVNITETVLATNGYLTTDLLDGGPDLSNDCPLPAVPSTPGGTPGARLYPVHDDLVADGYYEYFANCPRPSDYGISEGCSVFEWSAEHWPGSASWDFEAILYHTTGEIVYQIGPGNPELGGGSTTGLQDFSPPTTGLTYACNTVDSIPDNTAVCLYSPGLDAPWAIEDPITGTLSTGMGLDMDVIFDSSYVTATGTYTAMMRINGDYENSVPERELVMHVSNAGVAISGDQSMMGGAGSDVTYSFTVTNTGLITDSFDMSLSGSIWMSGVPSSTGPLGPGESTTVDVIVSIPVSGGIDSVVVTATSASDGFVYESATATTTSWDRWFLPVILKN